MEGQLWVAASKGLIVARLRGEPTETLLRECQEQVLAIARATPTADVHRVLYDTLEMTSPPVDVPLAQRELDASVRDVHLRRAIVVPDTRLAFLARLAFGEGDYRVFYDDLTAAIGWLGESRDVPREHALSTDIEYRMLGAADVGTLSEVADDVFDGALVPRFVAEFLRDPRHHLAVALDQRRVVGFASGVHYVHPDKPADLWINEVGVAPSHQGRGIGTAVVATLLEHATSLGCHEAWVLTDRSNQAAMRTYARAGGLEAPGDHVMFTFSLRSRTTG